MEPLPPIPSKAFHRWRPVRQQVLPLLAFLLICAGIALAWRQLANPASFVGQVEVVQASVNTRDAGLLTNLWVTTLQEVRAGDLVAEVITTDPRTANNRLEVLRDRMRLIELEMTPILTRQRSTIEYEQLTLSCARVKAELAIAQANYGQASNQLRRASDLFRDRIIAEKDYELARSAAEALRVEVEEKTRMVAATEKTLGRLSSMADAFVPGGENDPLKAAIGMEEERIRAFEQKLKPLELLAPIDGVVTMIHHRPGEQLVAGTVIVTITSKKGERIVGYLPASYPVIPKVGTKVEVQTRTPKRQRCGAKVTGVGPNWESLTNSLVPPVSLRPNLILPLGRCISISMPHGLHLSPGEAVDVRLLQDRAGADED